MVFYRAANESILNYNLLVWHTAAQTRTRKLCRGQWGRLKKIIGCSLPSQEDSATSHYLSRVNKIIKDPSYPGHHLFQLGPSGRRYMAAKARTSRLRDGFFSLWPLVHWTLISPDLCHPTPLHAISVSHEIVIPVRYSIYLYTFLYCMCTVIVYCVLFIVICCFVFVSILRFLLSLTMHQEELHLQLCCLLCHNDTKDLSYENSTIFNFIWKALGERVWIWPTGHHKLKTYVDNIPGDYTAPPK